MNRDKDIEYLQNKINKVNRKFTHEEVLKNIEAIEHIISELETYKQAYTTTLWEQTKTLDEMFYLEGRNKVLERELEIYKKTAKLLSKELIQYAELLEKDYGCYSMFAYNSPKEVIKWARKEVEND